VAGHAQDEHEHLGHRAVERLGDLVIELDLRERLGEPGILLDRHAVGAGGLDDLLADLPAALGDDTRRTRLLVNAGRPRAGSL
jgi:hypothetical protein